MPDVPDGLAEVTEDRYTPQRQHGRGRMAAAVEALATANCEHQAAPG